MLEWIKIGELKYIFHGHSFVYLCVRPFVCSYMRINIYRFYIFGIFAIVILFSTK